MPEMDHFLRQIDAALAEQRRSDRWLSLEIGKGGSYIRDIRRGRLKRLPSGEIIGRIAIALGKPVSYFVTDGARLTPPAVTERISLEGEELNRDYITRAEHVAQIVMRLLQNDDPGLRARIVVALYTMLTEAARRGVAIPSLDVTNDGSAPLIADFIARLLGC